MFWQSQEVRLLAYLNKPSFHHTQKPCSDLVLHLACIWFIIYYCSTTLCGRNEQIDKLTQWCHISKSGTSSQTLRQQDLSSMASRQ